MSYTIENDECMISFDVVSLFTSIPVHLALEITKGRLDSDTTLCERTSLSVSNIMKLLKLVLNNNYFILQDTYYKQIFGCPMGSPPDGNACLHRKNVAEFHRHLNSINEHIQFTVEEENNGSISFLDTTVSRNENGSINTGIFRNATHTNKYLQFN